jgi:cytochrome c oxidase subunit II
MDPAGSEAARVASHGWRMIALTGVASVASMGALLAGLLLGRRADEPSAGRRSPPRGVGPPSRRAVRAVVAATATVFGLLVFVFLDSLLLERAGGSELEGGGARVIEVTAHQWWWDVHYDHPVPALRARTANEIRLPLGEVVELHLEAKDVIHSLWIPNVAGKLDLVPGKTNVFRVRADREGVFRGQCAEFCGMQHALMALVVIVMPPEELDAWLDRQRAPAMQPVTATELRGREVFESRSCVLCHMIRGTMANATVAPDLTHVASRLTLASGARPNTREELARWVLEPEQVKPGSHMPATPLAAEELDALLDYLLSLE